MRILARFFACFVLAMFATSTYGASTLSIPLAEQVTQADAIMRGVVQAQAAFRDLETGQILTRILLRVDEPVKGRFPKQIEILHRGGKVSDEALMDSFAPALAVGDEYLLFLAQRPDETLFAADGAASVFKMTRKEAATGKGGHGELDPEDEALLERVRALARAGGPGIVVPSSSAPTPASAIGGLIETNGVSSRFTQPDRGEAIPYLIDAQALPAGITVAQALTAVSNALGAWSQVSSVRFVYEGLQNFGTASAFVNTNDGKLRLQLHDLYGYIQGANTLGIGGRSAQIPSGFGNAGGFGGSVAGEEFFLNNRGFLVLKHTSSSMQNLKTFEEVICHEIGHVLSLDHSSENPNEPNPVLAEAMMFFRVHGDGRGATLGSYDPPLIRRVHPLNTPPYGFHRMIDAISTPGTQPNIAGVNSAELRGYDLQNDPLTTSLLNATANNGSFSLAGNVLKFTAAGYFGSDSARIDPAGTGFYDRAFARFFDGVNGSPYVQVRVLSFLGDTQPTSGGDGIPDSWMVQYFGSANPNAGVRRRAGDDFDGDKISNFNEYQTGTNPTNAASVLKITAFNQGLLQFPARHYEVYEIESSTNLMTWSLSTNPVIPTVSNAVFTGFSGPEERTKFYRVRKIP